MSVINDLLFLVFPLCSKWAEKSCTRLNGTSMDVNVHTVWLTCYRSLCHACKVSTSHSEGGGVHNGVEHSWRSAVTEQMLGTGYVHLSCSATYTFILLTTRNRHKLSLYGLTRERNFIIGVSCSFVIGCILPLWANKGRNFIILSLWCENLYNHNIGGGSTGAMGATAPVLWQLTGALSPYKIQTFTTSLYL